MAHENLLEILYEALHSELGVVVECFDTPPETVRARLYALRKGNEELQALSFAPSPTNSSQLFILKKDISNDEAPTPYAQSSSGGLPTAE